MFGKPPEPVAAHIAQTQLWTEMNRMALFAGACAVLTWSIRIIERRASNIVLNA